MAWSQFNIPSNGSGTPDEQQNARGMYYPYESTAHQAPPSLAAEPSMFSENHLQYNTSMQHPSASAHSSCPVPFRFTHTDFDPPNPNTVHRPSIENNRLREPSMGYLSSGSSSACTTPSGSRGSTPAMQELPQSGIGGHEIQTTYGAAQRLQPRQDELHGTYQCNWKDCTYRGMFSCKGVLMRHIETQHVEPRSFECSSCGKRFSRRDNLAGHMGRVHRQLI